MSSDATVTAAHASDVKVTAEDARTTAEAAREIAWERPSFAKGLYLGNFEVKMTHPHPQSSAEDTAAGEAFLAKIEAYAGSLDGARVERESKIPDEYLAGLAELGAFGM